MSQHPDSYIDINRRIVESFKSALEGDSFASAAGYLKAVTCLDDFIKSVAPESTVGSAQFLEEWMIYMHFRNLTFKTALHYLDLVSALFGASLKANKEPFYDGLPNCFATVKKRIRGLGEVIWQSQIEEKDLQSFLNLVRTGADPSDGIKSRILKDIILVSLLNDAEDIMKIARLRKEEIENYKGYSREILERYVAPTRKYVFPLDQTKYTSRKFESRLEALFRGLFAANLISCFGDISSTIRTYWAYAALKCGIQPHAIVRKVGPLPIGMPILSVCSVSSGPSEVINNTLERYFISNPRRWYALRLRPGVSFDSLKSAIEDWRGGKELPGFFYPYEEIVKRVGKRMQIQRKPVIRDVVFFRCRQGDIPLLMRSIGDKAWIYKTGGMYAAIDDRAMRLFQSAVGAFGADAEIAPAGSLEIRENERVVILGGLFSGLEAEVKGIEQMKKGIIYRLKVFGDANDIEWRLTDPTLLHPLTLPSN